MGYAGLQPDDPREIGPYRLLGQLGSGGMGQVFLGMSAGGRPIAVKVIRTELATDPDFRARFRREVAAAQKVSGLFTALVVDADLDSPMPWLATAYVAGPSLTEAVRGHGPLPIRSLLALTAGLAEGLGAIHAAGVVHRDLKPSNVLLAEDGPRVIDFGISEAAEASAAAGANVMIGSPGYMSPEQVLGVDIGPASDVFSLGAVLTFAATGRGPFGAGSNAALMYRLVNSPADLSSVPDELRSLVGGCLAKHPGDRPTARELLAEVGALQPAPGWLAESIMNSFIQDPPAPSADLADPAAASMLIALTEASAHPPDAGLPPRSGQPPRSGPPPRGGAGGPGRHRISRTLASAILTGGLVAGSAVAAFALIGANHTPAVQPPPAADRRGCGGDRARLGVRQRGVRPAHVVLRLALGVGARLAERVPQPGPVPVLQHVHAADTGRIPVVRAADQFVQPDQVLGVLAARVVPAGLLPARVVSARVVSARVVAPASVAPPPASSPPASSPPASSPPASSPPASSPPASSPPASSPASSDPGSTSPSAPST